MDAPSPLSFQRCAACGAAVHPPRLLCPVDGSRELAWEQSAGEGVVYSATTVHGREGAHGLCLVDLDEGYRVMAAGAPAIGARVALRVEDGRLCAV
jgi:uncharacterized OB-fold protein